MGINFPSSPSSGQLYPASPVAGQAQWRWNATTGTWDAMATQPGRQPLYTDGNQTTTGGFATTPYNLGTISSGTLTPNPMNGNYQYVINNGAFTLAVPAVDCAIDLMITNGASAGTITTPSGPGWVVAPGNFGDPLTTTNGSRFILSLRRINGISTFVVKALQ